MRKYLRKIARAKMRREGIQRMNKHLGRGYSYFAQHWREYI